jgi:hypothetical protein
LYLVNLMNCNNNHEGLHKDIFFFLFGKSVLGNMIKDNLYLVTIIKITGNS